MRKDICVAALVHQIVHELIGAHERKGFEVRQRNVGNRNLIKRSAVGNVAMDHFEISQKSAQVDIIIFLGPLGVIANDAHICKIVPKILRAIFSILFLHIKASLKARLRQKRGF